MHIPRHKIDREAVQRRFDLTTAGLNVFITSVGRTPNNLTLLASNALDVVTCGSVVAPQSPLIHPALCIASRAIAALFAVASAQRFPMEVIVTDGPPVRYEFGPQNSLVHPNRWLEGFFLAALCRDYDSVQILSETPLELLYASSTRCPQYTYHFVDAICGFLEGAPDTGKRLLNAMEATDPDRADILKPDWTLNIDVPKIELFYHFATGDKEGFAQALPKAVERHRQYWSKLKDRDVSRNPDGFLALGPLGLAALAHDRRMPFAVDSDYFLRALMQEARTFTTEFP